MTENGGQIDRFIHERLPPPDQWPDIIPLPGIFQTGPLNCVEALLDRHISDAIALTGQNGAWNYSELNAQACRIANVFTNELGIVSGNRVLIRGGNSPEVAVIWLAIQKAGAVAVTTMSLLRAGELSSIMKMARPALALSETDIADELETAIVQSGAKCRLVNFEALETLSAHQLPEFETYPTHADDVALLAFTSGTTGKPKATIHFHRDVVSICEILCTNIIKPTPDDVFIGTSPLAFTFGLGGLLLFPLYAGASSVLLPRYSPEELLSAIKTYHASLCFTVPTFYQRMARVARPDDTASLRLAISSGETLPLPVRHEWQGKTGVEMAELLGSTEMLHAFIGAAGHDIRAGSIGRALPGYQAQVIDDEGSEMEPGTLGRLAVKGPTGCRYLEDPRQNDYVQNGWNITGDTCTLDEDGYVSYHARFDDMIISAGYNISATEVENALLTHPDVAECAVVAAPDTGRGQIVSAFVVAKTPVLNEAAFVKKLQEHVRNLIAPYKYPRAIKFMGKLPRNESGKIQRFQLRT